MTLSDDKLADLRVSHLEMVQGVIGRLASSGSAVKNHSATLTTGVSGAAIALGMPEIFLLNLVPVVVCALLDAQYLSLERRFRKHFDAVRSRPIAESAEFDLTLTSDRTNGFFRSLFSWSVCGFHGALGLGALIIYTAWRLAP